MARRLASRGCIVCGQENPLGLRLAFDVDRAGARAAWVAKPDYQGFDGVIHGGVVLALLDDAMWYAVYGQGAVALTAEATVRYKARVAVGAPVRVQGEVVERRGRLFQCRAEILHAGDGSLLASSQAKFVTVADTELPALVAGTGVHELPTGDGEDADRGGADAPGG